MSKGDSFERETCRAISLWWTDGKRDDVFWRNRTRVTSKTPNAERQLGDLSTVHTIGVPFVEAFNVEFKIGYSKTKGGKRHKIIPWDLLDLIDGKGKTFVNFWKQTTEDALVSNRMPLLIFKRDYHTPVVAMWKNDLSVLIDYMGSLPSWTYLQVCLGGDFHGSGLVSLYNFDEFFDWLRPDTVKLLSAKKQISKPSRILRRLSNASVSGDS